MLWCTCITTLWTSSLILSVVKSLGLDDELCEQVGRGRQLGSSSHLEEECLGDVRVAAKLDRKLPDPNAPRPKKRHRRSGADDETEDEEDVDCYDDED